MKIELPRSQFAFTITLFKYCFSLILSISEVERNELSNKTTTLLSALSRQHDKSVGQRVECGASSAATHRFSKSCCKKLVQSKTAALQ